MKPYLLHGETLPLANSDFVNRSITDKYLCNHLSANDLQKTSKIAFFRLSDPFVRADALNLGSKFEVSLTNSRFAEFAMK